MGNGADKKQWELLNQLKKENNEKANQNNISIEQQYPGLENFMKKLYRNEFEQKTIKFKK